MKKQTVLLTEIEKLKCCGNCKNFVIRDSCDYADPRCGLTAQEREDFSTYKCKGWEWKGGLTRWQFHLPIL